MEVSRIGLRLRLGRFSSVHSSVPRMGCPLGSGEQKRAFCTSTCLDARRPGPFTLPAQLANLAALI